MRTELSPRITVHTAMCVWQASEGQIAIVIEPVVVNPQTHATERRPVAEGKLWKFPLLSPANT